jgi:hypothetical protein
MLPPPPGLQGEADMKLATVNEFKSALLAELPQQTIGSEAGAKIESIVPERPEKRLAVGLSRIEKEEYHLEIRLQREGGWAYDKAKEYQAKGGGEVSVEVVEKVEVPSIVALQSAGLPAWMTKPYRSRPLHLGLAVGHPDGGSGTLGAFVETRDGKDGILSCNHVLAVSNRGDKKDKIFQPGPSEGKCLADNLVGRLLNYPELVRTSKNTTDAAVAVLEDDISHTGNRIPRGYKFANEGKKLRPPGIILDLSKGTVVCKIGRTTGFTRGRVTAIGLDGLTVYNPSIGNLMFDDVIEISWLADDDPFSLPGDSGSLLFTEDGLMPVGLHFAGGPGKSYACDLNTILDELELKLL